MALYVAYFFPFLLFKICVETYMYIQARNQYLFTTYIKLTILTELAKVNIHKCFHLWAKQYYCNLWYLTNKVSFSQNIHLYLYLKVIGHVVFGEKAWLHNMPNGQWYPTAQEQVLCVLRVPVHIGIYSVSEKFILYHQKPFVPILLGVWQQPPQFAEKASLYFVHITNTDWLSLTW